MLTNQRLILKTGVLIKRTDKVELYRVKDIKVDYSVVNQITGIGRISIRSSDITSYGHAIILRDISNAISIKESMRTLVEQARQKRRVREIDVDEQYG